MNEDLEPTTHTDSPDVPPLDDAPVDPWPMSLAPVQPWELDDFYRATRRLVFDLEASLVNGSLESRLEYPDTRELTAQPIAEAYARRTHLPANFPYHLRLDAVRAMMEQVRQELFAVEEVGVAERVDASPFGYPPARILARIGGKTAILRVDQFLSARSWGIGFDFEDPLLGATMSSLIAMTTVRRLGRDLRDLEKALRKFHPERVSDTFHLVPLPQEGAFERLVLDILNEHALVAFSAPLFEDVLEKTDIRVKLPGLARLRGGRLQVTQISDKERHDAKIAKIRNVEQMAILSPRTLAAFVESQMAADPAHAELTGAELAAIWESLPDKPSDSESLIASLKRCLLGSLRHARRTPVGPSASVPAPIRNLVQVFVRADVFRGTAVLRAAEARRGRQPPGLPQPPATPRPVPKPLLAEHIVRFEPGQRFSGVVKNIKDYGLFVDLGGIDALLHRSALTDSPEPLQKRFSKWQPLEVVILQVDAATGRIALALAPEAAASPD